MFTWIRRKLREIDYHSADRPSTFWTRATDTALVLTLLLAPLATWIGDRVVIQKQVVEQVSGVLARVGDDARRAFIHEHSEPPDDFWMRASQWGEWRVERIMLERGFPFPTTTQRATPNLFLDDYTKPGNLKKVPAQQHPAEHEAIMRVLRESGFENVAREFDNAGGPARSHRMSWMLGSAAWWIMLAGASFLFIQMARVGFGVVWIRDANRRFARRRAGLCVNCGYNLRGLEFNERCPECGHLVE